MDEISALHDTISKVYEPIVQHQNETINRLNLRIGELESEISGLRKQLNDERAEHQAEINQMRLEHQKEMDMMNRRIMQIASSLGIRANTQIRNNKGQFAKSDPEDEA